MFKRSDLGVEGNEGAILLEVLLVIVVLGVGLTLIIESLLGSLRARVTSRDHTLAMIFMDNLYCGILADKAADALSPRTGAGEGPFSDFQYQTTSQPAEFEGLDKILREVEVTLSWTAAGRTKRLGLRGLRDEAPEPGAGQPGGQND